MIAHTVFLLLCIGAFCSIKIKIKADKILNLVAVVSLFAVFAYFYNAMSHEVSHTFSFMWNTSQGKDLKFDIISDSYNYSLVLPCFLITILAALNNFIFRYEERRCAYTAVLTFNLIALILLLTSNNFVQLISALFMVDILALLLIKNNAACRRYCMLNMLADMVLFMVVAIINARVDSLDLDQILLYQKSGVHTDFTALIGLTAIFAKLGFAFFQIGVLGLKDVRFHQLQNVLFLSSPFAALILLFKFNALWRISEYFNAYLDIMCVLTAVIAFAGSIAVDNFKAKAIYWMMAFWTLMVELLRFYGFVWIPEFTALIIEMYVFMCALYLIYFYNNRQVLTSQMMRLRLTHVKRLISTLLIILLIIIAVANTLSAMYNSANSYFIWGFGTLFLSSVAIVIAQIYFYQGKRNFGVQHYTSYKSTFFIELLMICVGLLSSAHLENPVVLGSIVVFSFMVWLLPSQKLQILYKNQWLQQADWLGNVYSEIVKILRLCGRILGILIDRVFLDKFVLASAAFVSSSGLKLFRRLHSNSLVGGLLVIIVLGTLLWYSHFSGRGY